MELQNIKALPPSTPQRPEQVARLLGIIVQSDKASWLGAWLIRPVEMLDLHLAGIGREIDSDPLAMHAGLHVELRDGREFVVEQLSGTPRENFVSGLNWTPLETFKARNHFGWDATIPAACFRKIDEAIVNEAIDFLNRIEGRPFFDEDCTSFVERVFGKRRLFADSPTARAMGFGMRISDPALMLLKPDTRLDAETERLIRADILRAMPDPEAEWGAPNGHLWLKRILVLACIAAAANWMISVCRRRIRRRT